MNVIASNSITVTDIINAANNIATLNLGYLGISVTILALLGGAFYLFNIRPLKDTLGQQEKLLINLKKEVEDNLSSSKLEVKEELKEFETRQITNISSLIQQENDKLISEVQTKIAIFEKDFAQKFDFFASEKDSNLKTVLLAEVGTQLRTIEKAIKIDSDKSIKELSDKLAPLQDTLVSIKSDIAGAKEDIVDLKIEHHLKKNQVGALKGMIDKLNLRIDRGWNVESELAMIKKYITESGMPDFYLRDLTTSINKVSEDFKVLKEQILELASNRVYDPTRS